MALLARSLYLTAPRQLTWVDEPLVDLSRSHVLFKTLHSSISIGTELPIYQNYDRHISAITYPYMTGYENHAEVIAVGDAVTKWQVGDRAIAFYGHRTHAILHEDKAVPVPVHITPEVALSAILTCDVTKGIRKLKLDGSEAVLVTGGGAIGLFTVAMLRAYGVAMVDVIEPLAHRRELAQTFGARQTFAPDDRLHQHYHVGLECSSRQSAFEQLQQALVPQGRICVLADGNLEPLVLSSHFHHKELMIVGSSDGWDYHQHATWFFTDAQCLSMPWQLIYEHHISYEQLPMLFEQLATGALHPVKVHVMY